MAVFDDLKKPIKADLLICFYDVSKFLDIGKKMDGLELFELLNGMAVITIRQIKETHGRVIKFIGDAGLIVFPEEFVDEGVRALLALRDKITSYFESHGINIKIHFGVHFGEVVIGPYGEEPNYSIDIGGDNVNRASMLAGREYRDKFVISPEAFGKLKPETKELFYRYTPPIVYMEN